MRMSQRPTGGGRGWRVADRSWEPDSAQGRSWALNDASLLKGKEQASQRPAAELPGVVLSRSHHQDWASLVVSMASIRRRVTANCAAAAAVKPATEPVVAATQGPA